MTTEEKKEIKGMIKQLEAMQTHCNVLLRQVNEAESREHMQRFGANCEPSKEEYFLGESAVSLIEADGALIKALSGLRKSLGLEEEQPVVPVSIRQPSKKLAGAKS